MATKSPLDDDNLLAEFLIRLPPLPSSLRRASLVCKRWHSIVSDLHFLRRFRSHHGKAPLLGFVYHGFNGKSIQFISMLDSPNRIPAPHFSLELGKSCNILDSHHGLVLILDQHKERVHVWDPVIRDHRYVAIPKAFHKMIIVGGVVLCSVKDQDHVHGACHSIPFMVVLVYARKEGFDSIVYSSKTKAWGNVISLPKLWSELGCSPRPILTGNSVYWLLVREEFKILQFDLDKQSLAFIDVPADLYTMTVDIFDVSIVPADSGGMYLFVLEGFTVRVWERMCNGTFAAKWMLGNTFELSKLLSLRPSGNGKPVSILTADEDGNVVFEVEDGGVVTVAKVHLGTMQFKKLTENLDNWSVVYQYFPFTSFCTGPGT